MMSRLYTSRWAEDSQWAVSSRWAEVARTLRTEGETVTVTGLIR